MIKNNNNLIDFNHIIYLKLNPDLNQSMNKNNCLKHFLNIGIKENRKYKINIPSDFNPQIYLKLNSDIGITNNNNNNNIINHYLNYGYFENRRYKVDIPLDFDHLIYKSLNNLNNNLSKENCELHYTTIGYFNNYKISPDIIQNNNMQDNIDVSSTNINNDNMIKNLENKKLLINPHIRHNNYKLSLPDIKKSKICIIYAYYEIKNQQKNQTNLSFFIRHGLNKQNWLDLNITCLFVINDFITEVFIPNQQNFLILREQNCSDFDAWYNGIKYLEKKFNSNIAKLYDYVFFINSGIIGPFMKPDNNNHWLIPFYNKMIDNNSPICSTCITFLADTDAGGPGPRIVSYNFLVRMDNIIHNLLFNTYIQNICPESINKDTKMYKNTIIGRKKSKEDAILTGEYGISRILIDYKYNLSCLLYDIIDYTDKQNWILNNNLAPDRYISHSEKELPIEKILFIKNIWKLKNDKICLPVQINETNNLINLYSNFNKIIFSNLNYNNLSVNSTGINITDNSKNWNNKEEFYNLYGDSEEYLIFPTKTLDNKGIVLYFYYDPEDILRDFAIIALKSLIQVGYDIYFCTTCNILCNVDNLPFKIHYFKNYGQGSEMIYWLKVLKNKYNIFKTKYEWIMLVNETVLFPINGLENFINTINSMRSKSDFWGHWESYENNHHLISSLIEFNIKIIPDLIDFYTIKLSVQNRPRSYYILEMETKQTLYLINKGYKYASVIPYESLIFSEKLECPIFHPDIMYQWLNRSETFAVKWKYMNNFINPAKFNNNIFNWISKYIHFGPNGPKGAPEISGAYKYPEHCY
jgi:hypothetical protein